MHGLFTRSLAEAWRSTTPAPARPVRKLTRTQHLLAILVWVCCIPLLLLAFLLLGERPHLKTKA
jgi:hypothetical protein